MKYEGKIYYYYGNRPSLCNTDLNILYNRTIKIYSTKLWSILWWWLIGWDVRKLSFNEEGYYTRVALFSKLVHHNSILTNTMVQLMLIDHKTTIKWMNWAKNVWCFATNINHKYQAQSAHPMCHFNTSWNVDTKPGWNMNISLTVY